MTGFEFVIGGTDAKTPDISTREVVVRLRTDALSIGSAFIADKHVRQSVTGGKPGAGEEPGLYQLGNMSSIMISPFSLRGWLRHGIEDMLHQQGMEVCHPMNPDAMKGASKKNPVTGKRFAEEDLEYGYHAQGSCMTKEHPEGCLVAQIFGALGRGSLFLQKQVIASPVASHRKFQSGIGRGYYRTLHISPTTRSPEGERVPFRTHTADMLAFVDIPWRLKIRENVNPEKTKIIMGLFVHAFDWLDENREEYFHQLGGKRNFGCGIVRTAIVNPFYGEKELETLSRKSGGDEESEDETIDETRPLGILGTATTKESDEKWETLKRECFGALDKEMVSQKKMFPYKKA